MPDQPIYVPVSASQEVFSISRDTIYRAAKRKEIVIHKAGARSLLKVEDVCKWIEGRSQEQ